MRRILTVLGLVAALFATALIAAPVLAQEAQPRDEEIEAVISNQLDAFLDDDVETAFSYAGPGIQSMFGTPENFGMMVQRGYPMVWRPEDVTFGQLSRRDGRLWQTVRIRDGDGALHLLEYEMLDLGGRWRIGGVRLLEPPGVSV